MPPPLPFSISFSLSFVTLWMSSLSYLMEWVLGKQVFTPCTALIYPFPIHYQIKHRYSSRALLALVWKIWFNCALFILFGFRVAVRSACTVSVFLDVTVKHFWNISWQKVDFRTFLVGTFIIILLCNFYSWLLKGTKWVDFYMSNNIERKTHLFKMLYLFK